MNVFRIKVRFSAKGIGTVYGLKIYDGDTVAVNDILSDLQGNRFLVKTIELFRNNVDVPFEEKTVYCTFSALDEVDVKGDLLIRGPAKINFLFCNHPLYPRKVDEDFEEEYQNAILGHDCALFSYEDLCDGKLSLYG